MLNNIENGVSEHVQEEGNSTTSKRRNGKIRDGTGMEKEHLNMLTTIWLLQLTTIWGTGMYVSGDSDIAKKALV